jgi:hypothetical protein
MAKLSVDLEGLKVLWDVLNTGAEQSVLLDVSW